MPQPIDQLPKSLRERTRFQHLGPAPALIAHPGDWDTPAPFCLWLHGRSVNKELDPGRYSRWLRAGIGAVAIDLPGHGERADPPRHGPETTLEVIAEALPEIDQILDALRTDFADAFDTRRAAIGGMSMGGMITLRRLCDDHPFTCAAVEGTAGDLAGLYFPTGEDNHNPWPVKHNEDEVHALSAAEHLDNLTPIPLLALHSEADEMVPWGVQKRFLEKLREHFEHNGASTGTLKVQTWPETGAPAEHVGFGRFSHEAKTIQTEFLAKHLLG